MLGRTIPIAILRYISLRQLQRSEDYQWDAFTYTLVSAIHLPVALFLVSASFVKPFVDSVMVVPQVIGESAMRRPSHPNVYPGGNFAASVVGGTKKSRRGGSAIRSSQAVFPWSSTQRPRPQAGDIQASKDLSSRTYIQLNDAQSVTRSTLRSQNSQETPVSAGTHCAQKGQVAAA